MAVESDFDFWNEDIETELDPNAIRQTITYSRAWTVQTIQQQIEQGNIDLNPNFQRRNAWTDDKRSRLIESLVLNVPVPEVILAEREPNSKKFLVLDGKQRLQAIIGFIEPGRNFWDRPVCRGLKVETDLNNKRWDEISTSEDGADLKRRLLNADVRCTVISNVQNDDVLYDIFFRLNSGSVPLSSQELRHSLYHGEYSDYVSSITAEQNALWSVLKLSSPDKRLRDAELFHRLVLFFLVPHEYQGNLKRFLDQGMGRLNEDWPNQEHRVRETAAEIEQAYARLKTLLGDQCVGRKYVDGAWEKRFNKALFEVEMYYARFVSEAEADTKGQELKSALESLMMSDGSFMATIESTTKTVDRYSYRFDKVKSTFESVLDRQLPENPYA